MILQPSKFSEVRIEKEKKMGKNRTCYKQVMQKRSRLDANIQYDQFLN